MAVKKQIAQVSSELIGKVYDILGAKPPEGRAIHKLVVVLEPGRPVSIDEQTFMLEDAPEKTDAPAVPAEAPVTEAKTDTSGDAA